MIKKILFLSVLLWHGMMLGQTIFEKANALYQKEQYQEAAALYESIVTSGEHSPEVYYNLGNCYYKMQQVAPAIFNYEKALLLNPNDAKIKGNLAFAQKMTIDDIKTVPEVGFSKWINNTLKIFHFNTWAVIAVVFSFLFFGFFFGYYFAETSTLKRAFFSGMIIMLSFCLISVLAAWLAKGYDKKEQPAIVFAEQVSVKSEPQKSASEAFVLHEGTKVFILGQQDNWLNIKLTDQTEGWLQKNAVKTLKP